MLSVTGTSLTVLYVDCCAVPRDVLFPPLATQVSNFLGREDTTDLIEDKEQVTAGWRFILLNQFLEGELS